MQCELKYLSECTLNSSFKFRFGSEYQHAPKQLTGAKGEILDEKPLYSFIFNYRPIGGFPAMQPCRKFITYQWDRLSIGEKPHATTIYQTTHPS